MHPGVLPITSRTLHIDSPGSVSELLLRACEHLDQSYGFTESTRPTTILLHTPRTPASALVVRGYLCAFQDHREVCSTASRGCPPDATPSVPLGVAGTRGLVCTNSGGPRPGLIQLPAAGTRSGGFVAVGPGRGVSGFGRMRGTSQVSGPKTSVWCPICGSKPGSRQGFPRR